MAFVDFDPPAKQEGSGFIDFSKPMEPRNLLKEVPTQLYAGATIDLPKQVGQAMQWMSEPGQSTYEKGKEIAAWAERRETENPDLAPQTEGRGLIGRALSTGARALAPSIAIMAPAAAGAVAAPAVGATALVGTGVGAAAGAFGLFGAAQAQETYDKLLKSGVPEDEARKAGWINMMIEGGGETIGDIAGLKLFGMLGKAVGANPVSAAIKGATDSSFVAPFLKQLGKTGATEEATEFGQNFGEAWVERKFGATNGEDPLHAGVQGAEAALGMTLLLAPFGLAGFAQRAKRNEKVADALTDPEAPEAMRIAAGRIVYDEINAVNPEAAKAWSQNVTLAIAGKAPVILDEVTATPKPIEQKIARIDTAGDVDEAIALANDAVASVPVVGQVGKEIEFAQNGRMVLEAMERRIQEEQAYAARDQRRAELDAELATAKQEDRDRVQRDVLAGMVARGQGNGPIAQKLREALGMPETVQAPAKVEQPAGVPETRIPETAEQAQEFSDHALDLARNLTRSDATRTLIDEEIQRRKAAALTEVPLEAAAPAAAAPEAPQPAPVEQPALAPAPIAAPAAVAAPQPAQPEVAPVVPAGPVEPASAPPAPLPAPLRIRGQLPSEMTIAQLQSVAQDEHTQYPDWQAAVAKELKARDRKGETFFGRTVDQLSDTELRTAATKGRNAALRNAAAAEAEKRVAGDRALAETVKRPEIVQALRSFAEQAGWAERGGHMIRRKTGERAGQETISRTVWIPRAEWWRGRPVNEGEDFYKAAIEKAIAGESLTKKQKDVVRFLVGMAEDERSGVEVPAHITPSEAILDQTVADQQGPAPSGWATMTEDEKNAELDAIFGPDSGEKAPPEGAQVRQEAAQGEVGPRGEERPSGERQPGQDDEVAGPSIDELRKYAAGVVSNEIPRIYLVGSAVNSRAPRDVDLLYELDIHLGEDPEGAIEAAAERSNMDSERFDTFYKVGDRYFHLSSGAGRSIVENTDYAEEQAGKERVLLAERPTLELSAQSPQDLKAKETQAATGNIEERTAALRDRNDAILTSPEGTAPPRAAADRQVPTQQDGLFGAAQALRTAADAIEKATKPAERIGDFGEKIGGARKDVWQAFKDKLKDALGVDVATEPLSKSWPEPDYQALLDSGADPWAVAFMHAARDAVPVKPRAGWKLGSWTTMVTQLREITMKLADGSASIGQASVQATLAKMGAQSRSIQDIAGRIELYELVGHSKSLVGVRISSGQYGVFEGKEYNPPKMIWTVEKKSAATAMSNWPTQLASGATKAEALAQFKEKFASLKINERTATEGVTFDIFSKRNENGYWIGKKIGRNPTLLEGPFTSIKEARAYKAEHQDELVAKLEKAKEIPNLRRDTNEPRVGEDMRDGKDVTPQIFGETFGFRGVEFGNWVEQGKRQQDLNDAFDALMDMAAVLNVPPRALSLDGQLGLAFGARGTGGVEAAKAHYERDHVVINLTKKEGAGSLSHEWWHALDNYFSRMREKGNDYLTEGLDVSLAARGSAYQHAGAVRKEMVDAFGQVVRAIKETALRARSAKLDAKRSKDYWTTGREMAARAFESYLISKLQDHGASNDYLANIVDEKTWKAAESLGFELEDTYPYPTAGEVPKIRAGFDHFFSTVQTKDTEKGVAMFSRQADNIERYAFQRGNDKNGQPAFANDEIVLANAEPDRLTRGEGVRSYKWNIYDRTKPGEKGGKFLKVGQLYADLTPEGKFEALRGITIYNRFKQQGLGYGESTVASMLAHNGPGTRMAIVDIVHSTPDPKDNALPFWKKMGVRQHNVSNDPNVEINGDLSLGDYLRARGEKSTFSRDGQASTAQAQPAGRQAGPEGNARAREAGSAAGTGREGVPGRPDRANEAVGLTESAVRRAVAPILEKWGNAPQVRIIASMADAPEAVRTLDEGQRSQGASGAPEAFIHRNTVYLVAEGLDSPATATRALFHESLGHFGLRGVFGDRLDSILDDVARSAPNRVKAKALEYGLDFEKADERRQAAEEVLAAIAQATPNAGVVRRAIAAIRQFLRDMGIELELSDNDIIANFILPARDFVERAQQVEVREAAPAFSRGVHMGTLTTAQEAALRNVHGDPETWRTKLDEFKANWKKNLVQGIFDQYAPIAQYSVKAYRLARQTKAGDSTLEALLVYGKVYVDKDGAYKVDYTKQGGMQGFAKVIADLHGEQDRFLEWVAAHRAERLKSIGLENLYSDADIAALKTLSQETMKDGKPRAAAYAKALKDLNEFNDSVLKIAVDSGLIDEATRLMYKDMPYVPFYRLQEEGVSGFGMKAGLVNQSAWKKLKGGTAHLNEDLLANLLQNWSHMITAAAKNRAAKATLEAAVSARVAEEVPSGTPGKGLVHFMDAGKERVFRVSDAHLMEAVAAMHYAGLGPVAKPFIAMKRYLTIGVTVNPAFKIRNLIRDSIQAIGTAELSYNPAKNIAQGFKATEKDSETRAQLLAGGGMIRFGSMLDGNNADRTRRLIEQGVDPEMILDNASKIERFWKSRILPAFEAYQEFGDRGEQISRAALYEQLLAKGMSHEEAAFWARDLLDFNLSGKWGAVRILTEVVPFANARLQGMYKLGRATKADYRRMGTTLGAVALASIALLLAYGDDDDWKKREDWDRDNYWWFKIGGFAFRIPKPFEIGAIGTLAERSLEYMINKEMTGKRFRERIAATVFSQLNMNPTPQLVKPLMDLYANKDSFSGRPIETMGMEKLRKQDRYTERTSEIAKFLGALGLPDPTQLAMGQWNTLSPVQIDSLVRGYFGWLGTSTTTALDWGIRPMLDRGQRPDMKLRDTFLAGNFVETLPANSSRYVTQLYDQTKEIEQAYGSYHDALKRGDREKAAEVMKDEGEKIRKYKMVETIKRRESLLTAQARRIESSKEMSGDEKRRRLDQIEQRKSDLARMLR